MTVKLEIQYLQEYLVGFSFLKNIQNLLRLKASSLRWGGKQEEHYEASRCDSDAGHHERQAPIGLGLISMIWNNVEPAK